MSVALHRTTRQLVRRASTGRYDVEDWIINPDLTGLDGVVDVQYWKITGDHVTEMTAAEKTAVDDAPTNMVACRTIAHDEIDERTSELISQGFTHATSVFSLSDSAQRNWLGLQIGVSSGIIGPTEFPVGISTIDNESYELQDADEAVEFFTKALGTVKYWLESGRDLKVQVNNATTKAAIEAIVDNR